MPIEFRCPRCQKLLHTPDGSEGKQAKCPECGAISEIPIPRELRPGEGPSPTLWAPPPPGSAETGNPYQSPGDYAYSPSAAGPMPIGPGAWGPRPISAGEIISRTWILVTSRWSPCLAATAVLVAIQWAISIPAQRAMGPVAPAMQPDELLALIRGMAPWWLVNLAIWTWIIPGKNIYFLKVARGEQASLADLFSGGRYVPRVFLAGVLFWLIFIGGYFLCIVPGIILALMFSQFGYLIVDRNAGAIESLSMSQSITSGNKLALAALWIILFVASAILTLIVAASTMVLPPYLGGILASLIITPFWHMLWTVAYLAMSGQPTFEQLPMGSLGGR